MFSPGKVTIPCCHCPPNAFQIVFLSLNLSPRIGGFSGPLLTEIVLFSFTYGGVTCRCLSTSPWLIPKFLRSIKKADKCPTLGNNCLRESLVTLLPAGISIKSLNDKCNSNFFQMAKYSHCLTK